MASSVRKKKRERQRGSGNASFDKAKLKLVRNKLNFCHITLCALSLLCLQHCGACLIESTDIGVIQLYPGSRARSWRAFVLPWARSEQQYALMTMTQSALNHTEFKCSEQEAAFLWERFWFIKRTVVSLGWSHTRDEETRTTPSAPNPTTICPPWHWDKLTYLG